MVRRKIAKNIAPHDWEYHLAREFKKEYGKRAKNMNWNSNKSWTAMMLKRGTGVFEKIRKRMATDFGLELLMDKEFNRDAVWYTEECGMLNSEFREKEWHIHNVIEVENDWNTIRSEILQLFHIRTEYRTAVFYPPKNITIQSAVNKISDLIPQRCYKPDDRLLVILIPEVDLKPVFFRLTNNGKGKPDFHQIKLAV